MSVVASKKELHSMAIGKKITALEFIEKLNADPDYVASRAQKDRELDALHAELAKAEAPVLEDLRKVGVDVSSVWALLSTPSRYDDAWHVLLKHFGRPYPDAIREGIARALAVKKSKPVCSTLMRLYREEKSPRVKSGLAAAIAVSASKEDLADIIALVREPAHGSSRLLLLSTLSRSKASEAKETLFELKDDLDLRKEIGVILKRAKASKARSDGD